MAPILTAEAAHTIADTIKINSIILPPFIVVLIVLIQ
jgi:hypothetical protein